MNKPSASTSGATMMAPDSRRALTRSSAFADLQGAYRKIKRSPPGSRSGKHAASGEKGQESIEEPALVKFKKWTKKLSTNFERPAAGSAEAIR
jgi:hypothetical protein